MNELNDRHNRIRTSVGNVVNKNILIFETVTVFISGFGFVLRNWLVFVFSFLILIGISILAIAYFFRAFAEVGRNEKNDETKANELYPFLFKLFNLSASVGSVGVMFRLMNWPQSEIMLLSGLSGIVITFVSYVFFLLHSKKEELVGKELIRMIILAAVFFLVQM